MQDTQLTFRNGFVMLFVPVIVAMMQPSIRHSALSIISMSDGVAFCAGTHCLAKSNPTILVLQHLIGGASLTRRPTAMHANGPGIVDLHAQSIAEKPSVGRSLTFAAAPWGHLHTLICELVRGAVNLAYLLVGGLIGVSTPTHLDLSLIASVDPHGDRTSECPVAPVESASTPRADPWKS